MGSDPLRLLATVPNLIHVSDDQPGWSRRRHGRGFRYFREDGSPITDRLIRHRLRSFAIPPAWTGVWICPLKNGHLLSTGRDEAGRKQYRYHPDFSSRFFRTWAGTAAAVREYWELLAEEAGNVPERPDLRVTERVAEFLGNTVDVCRKYYIHPNVLAAIVDGNLPPAQISRAKEKGFGETFDVEEIIAYRLCSAPPAPGSPH